MGYAIKLYKNFISILLIFMLLLGMSSVAFASDNNRLIQTVNTDVSTELNKTSKFIVNSVSNPVISMIGGEWSVIGLARSGFNVPEGYFEKYYANVVAELKEKDGNLTKNKYSEYSRLILALTSIGHDVTNVGGYNILEKLADYNSVIKQGINGPIFALIAIDSKNYKIPQVEDVEVQTTREMLIDYILKKEVTNNNGVAGGFSLTGNAPDPDITGMAIQALAKYKNQPNVKAAIDRALIAINNMELKDGSFTSWGEKNSESIIQIIIAKCSLNIDSSKNVSALMKYYTNDGSFQHTLTGGTNLMATEQGLYALAAYDRYLKNKNTLYDMTDVTKDIRVTLNGNYLTFKQLPVNIQGSVLVPMRTIFEAMGADIYWDNGLKKVTGVLGTKKIELTIGNTKAYVNGAEVTLDVPGCLINSSTMVPIRFISESFDADVEWNQKTKTVIILK